MRKHALTVAERFDRWVEPEPMSGCWLWSGTTDRQGYGEFSIEGRIHGAHRASWLLHRGPILIGLCVLHKCDVASCVNPAHLYVGTKYDNMRDMAARGRHVLQKHPERNRFLTLEPWLRPRGENHWIIRRRRLRGAEPKDPQPVE